MDFFAKAKESLTNASKDLTQKASEGVELAKIATHIRDVEREYDDMLKKLAAEMLEKHYDEVKAMCPEMIESIEANRTELEKAKKEQDDIRNDKPENGAEVKFCTKCGKKLESGAKFCTGCGNPID